MKSKRNGYMAACIAVICLAMLISFLNKTAKLAESSHYFSELRQRYVAAQRIPNELRYRVHRNWKGKGQVLTGRLHIPVGVDVARRTTIEADGSFATAVYPGRQLTYYAHGYEPLIIEPGRQLDQYIDDTGEHWFEKASPERTRTLTGSVVPDPTNGAPPQVEIKLTIPNDDPLSDDHGHWQHRIEPTVDSTQLTNGGSFQFEGLSHIPYELVLQANGYVQQTLKIDPSKQSKIDLGSIRLLKAQVLRFHYIANIDTSSPSSDWPNREMQTVVGDGRQKFKFVQDLKNYRNRRELRLFPQAGFVEAGFTWVPSEFYDLGQGTLNDFIHDTQWTTHLPDKISDRRLPLEDGHVYFFRNKKKETNCLFQVSRIHQ